jgi:transcriptional regulator with XRE-family HTH domain
MGVSPLVRRRRLAAELRRLRATAEKSIEDVAEHLECSTAKVRRIEAGQVGTRVQDVRELLDFYGVTDPERDTLVELSRQARARGWWHGYAEFISEEFMTYLGLEDEASTVSTYETYFVPALLQTERYARAVMTGRPHASLITVERGLEIRRMRWRLLDRSDPPLLHALIEEGALRRTTGRAGLMAEQYDHLVAVSALPDVTIQVLPLASGSHPDGGFPFTLLGFTDPADPKIGYAELLISEYYTDEAKHIGRYQAAFDQLRGRALDPDESVALIKACAAEVR